MKMSTSYEQEQKNLELTIAECEQALREADKAKVDLRMLLKGLREFTELKELTPEIVNTLIQRTSMGDSFPLVRFFNMKKCGVIQTIGSLGEVSRFARCEIFALRQT